MEVVWPWKEADGGTATAPVGQIRMSALGQGLVGGLVGTAVYFFLSTAVGLVAWCLSAVIALIGLVSPTGLYAKVSEAFQAFGRLVGKITSWLLLVPVYFLFFAPFRFLFRRGRRDSMTRWLDPDAESYWVVRPSEIPDSSAYERQF